MRRSDSICRALPTAELTRSSCNSDSRKIPSDDGPTKTEVVVGKFSLFVRLATNVDKP